MPVAGLAPDRSPVGATSSVVSAIMLFLRARALGAQGNVVRHMQALPHGEVASAIKAVRASNARRS